jgi:hypothetical protein
MSNYTPNNVTKTTYAFNSIQFYNNISMLKFICPEIDKSPCTLLWMLLVVFVPMRNVDTKIHTYKYYTVIIESDVHTHSFCNFSPILSLLLLFFFFFFWIMKIECFFEIRGVRVQKKLKFRNTRFAIFQIWTTLDRNVEKWSYSVSNIITRKLYSFDVKWFSN